MNGNQRVWTALNSKSKELEIVSVKTLQIFLVTFQLISSLFLTITRTTLTFLKLFEIEIQTLT